MPLPELVLRARYVFPIDSPPIEWGCVRIAGDRILSAAVSDRQPDIDCGNSAIVPGFINAHTHLELSSLRAREFADCDFVTWLHRVMAARVPLQSTQITHAITRGIDASLAAGTTLVGDISTSGRSWKVLLRSSLRAVVFAELIGLKPSRATETAAAARQFLEWTGAAAPLDTPGHAPCAAAAPQFPLNDDSALDPLPQVATRAARLSPTLSPHAPFSTHEALYDFAADWAERSRAPLCTHLAESREELRLLEKRDGALFEFLVSIGAWDDHWTPAGKVPADYVSGPRAGADWVLAHGNYLTSDEIGRLAAQHAAGHARSIIYCPRTHAYFGHSRHPYAEMIRAGLNVCLGTDSLASTPSLSVLDEMRFLHRRDGSLAGDLLLQMGTLAGARALNRDAETGSLTPGKFADLAIVRLPDRDDGDPHRLLFDSSEPVVRTMIGGRIVFHRSD